MIEIEHVQRWKKEFPEYFTKEKVGENEPPKNKVPKFCKGPNNWRDWFNKQEPFVRGMFNWKTNEYDIRLVFVSRFYFPSETGRCFAYALVADGGSLTDVGVLRGHSTSDSSLSMEKVH